jgi:hypothetical protein
MAPPIPFITDEVIVNILRTVRLIDVVWVTPLAALLRIRGYVPAADDEPTLIVRVELPEPGAAIESGLNDAVVPVGSPAAESETALLKLPRTVVLTVVVPADPGGTDIVSGVAIKVKSGIQLFTREYASTEPRPVAGS